MLQDERHRKVLYFEYLVQKVVGVLRPDIGSFEHSRTMSCRADRASLAVFALSTSLSGTGNALRLIV
jgi:hypothetical protein